MDRGAHFYRCDFQVHTPRDANWRGSRPGTEAERIDYAERFVAKCRALNLNAVAITDHHDFAFFEYLKEAANREQGVDGSPIPSERRLIVFPGLELTLGVPCQALMILDADFPPERLNNVLDRLALNVVDPVAGVCPAPGRIDHVQSLLGLQEELDRNSDLRGRYIVLPNVTDGGHGTLMRQGMQMKYKEMPCVGGYLDQLLSEVGHGNRQKFAGLDAAWGNKRLALFQTSDSRAATFADLGKRSTWVKWATPTAEALRQACLAEESRISHSVPTLPTIMITRLSVSNSMFMGPIELALNPQYNAIIGGRGTGKSTCLEYLRWALCDQQSAAGPTAELPDHATRRARLIEDTLKPYKGHVDVHFDINGIPHVLRRYAETGDLMLKVGPAEFSLSRPEEIRSLLPIEAYSQRQLSSVSVRLDELTRFVKAPIRRQLEDLVIKQAALAAALRTHSASLERHRMLSSVLAADELTVSSISEQIVSLRDSLEAVSDSDRRILDQRSRQEAANELARTWERKLDQSRQVVRDLEGAIERLRSEIRPNPDTEIPGTEVLSILERSLRLGLEDVARAATSAAEALGSATSPSIATFEAQLSVWRSLNADCDSQYQAAKERTSTNQSRLSALGELETRRRELQEASEVRHEELRSLGDPASDRAELRSQWLALQSQRADLLHEQCESLTKASQGLIRATLKRSADLRALIEQFRSVTAGSGVRGGKIQGFFEALAVSEDPQAEWERCLSALEARVVGDEPPKALVSMTLLNEHFGEADLNRLADKATPESLLALALTPIDDMPRFEYQTKDGEYIGFEVASAGQQATALLRVLLNQGGPPLVIDQPEDDLDSQVILDVVSQIWTAKTTRQLIFSSHNANLVVNGDAELVICCDYRAAGDQSGGRLKVEGAIDVPEVRKEITVVMEGGERAFRLRKDKYGF